MNNTQVSFKFIYTDNYELYKKTEKTLRKIEKKENWTLERYDYSDTFSHIDAASWSLSAGLFSGFILSLPFNTVALPHLLGAYGLKFAARVDRNYVQKKAAKLNDLAEKFTKDSSNPNHEIIAEGLKAIANIANDYIASRNYANYCFAATWALAGITNTNLTTKLAIVGAGCIATAGIALHHYSSRCMDLNTICNKVLKLREILKTDENISELLSFDPNNPFNREFQKEEIIWKA